MATTPTQNPVANNDIQMDGLEFIEFSSPQPQKLEDLFWAFGFSKTMKHQSKNLSYFRQNDIHFIVNAQAGSKAETFHKAHGPSVSSMAWRFKDAKKAHQLAISRGAEAVEGDYQGLLAIKGIGGSLIYFIDQHADANRYEKWGFQSLGANAKTQNDKGFLLVDHLTNNVEKGEMKLWADFYKNVFGFVEVRYFDIRGAKTGLTSFALRSPCGKFCIPINEGTEAKSQINEYLLEYKGPGVQHIAFLTRDILASLDSLTDSIETLDIDDEYYAEVFNRVPNVTEDHKALRDHHILVDGDEEGYLLQIFTKNIIGPIFVEIIQRKNHLSFGEGNFGALFRSIERDQEKRGFI